MEIVAGRALVTGAAGFVGTILSAHLRKQGWAVTCSDHHVPQGGGADWFACDISDAAQIDQMVAWAGSVTHVFHLAAVTFVPEAGRNPSGAFNVNLLGTVHVAEAVARHAPDARLIYVSTAEVYGHPQFLPITESHPLDPTNPYAISKAAADQYCAYLNHVGRDVVRVRPFNHTGPGQSDLFVLSSFARQIAQIESGKLPPVLQVGNIEAARDFSHVGDVVRAYECLALKGVSGEVYNVCSGHAVTVRDALDQLLALAQTDIRIEVQPERMRPVDVPCAYGSYEKLARDTGWRPEIPFERLLAELLEFWRARERQG